MQNWIIPIKRVSDQLFDRHLIRRLEAVVSDLLRRDLRVEGSLRADQRGIGR